MIPGSGRSPEKEMATHSSTLAGRIPWTEEPGGLQSVGSQPGTTERLTLLLSRLTEMRPPGAVQMGEITWFNKIKETLSLLEQSGTVCEKLNHGESSPWRKLTGIRIPISPRGSPETGAAGLLWEATLTPKGWGVSPGLLARLVL